MLKIEIESELRYRLKSNESMLLDNPETFWIVQSGVISLFAVPIVDGVAEGTRHYLFSVKPGEALLSTIQTADGQGILAVSAEESELLQLPREQFSQRIANADPEIIALVENWIDKMGAAISANSSAPIGCYPISSATHSLTLTRGQCCETAKTSWLQIQQGSAKWMGLEELTVNPTSGLLPLGGGIWLLAEGTVELTISSTVEIQSEQTLLDNLAQLQIYCLRCIDLQQQNSLLEDWVRFQQRQQLNRQVAEEAVGELATVLQPRKRDEARQGTQLLIAAGAVGRALGVEIRPPARSENLERVKEPLEAIARASKLRMRRVLLTGNWWHQDCGPLLGYMTDQSPVALLPISTTCYELFDPVDMTRTRVDATIRDRLSQEAYTFYRPLPQAVHKAWDFLKFGLEGQTRDLLTVFIAGIATTLLGMLIPQATAIIIDNVIPDTNRGLLLQVGLGLFAAACGVGIFRLAQGVALLRAESLAESSTQAAIWNRLLSLGIPFFRAYSTGELEARVSAINKIRRTLGGNTLTNLFSSLFSLLNLGLLFYYSTSLALIAVAVALLAITFTITSSIMTLQKVRPLEKLKGQIQGLTVQLISGVTKLRVAAAEVRAFAYWSKYYSQQQKLVLKTERIENNLAVFNELLPLLSSILLFGMAVYFTHKTPELSIGNFLAFNTAFGSFLTGATSFTNSIVSLLEIIALWEQAKPILEAKPEVDDSKADPGRLAGKLAVDHVTFRYGHDGPITLDDVSLNADPGEFIALVGPSGSGKSTIFRLLLGFETSASGAIYYDGQDLSGLDTQAVRRQLGVVLQNNQVTSASIFENISGGALITLDEAWEAARSAGFADDIVAMPMGMHTVVSEGGTNLSGGQRQRLLIARALALKPRILLFDEATSALDNKTQSIVSDSLNRLQVTRVVIAHRLSTIQNADRIYVLQAGRVVQQGTFEELTHQEGLFAQLMARQIA